MAPWPLGKEARVSTQSPEQRRVWETLGGHYALCVTSLFSLWSERTKEHLDAGRRWGHGWVLQGRTKSDSPNQNRSSLPVYEVTQF